MDDERPPYPILIDNPFISQVLENMNKSDILLGLSWVGLGFLSAIYCTRKFVNLSQKFFVTKHVMWWFTFTAVGLGTLPSYLRLTGFLDNGLRWKHKDMLYSKYDFTKDFEANTIFKHLRTRID
jgi:hypothetical protein